MLTQLHPILTRTNLTLTLAAEGDLVRLCVIPVAKEGVSASACAPFTCLDTLDQLEAQLPDALTQYSTQVVSALEAVGQAAKVIEESKATATAQAKEAVKKQTKPGNLKVTVPPKTTPKPVQQNASAAVAAEAEAAAAEAGADLALAAAAAAAAESPAPTANQPTTPSLL